MSTVLEYLQNALALPLRKLRPVSSKNSSEKNPHSCLLEIDYMHQGDLLNCSNILTDSEAYAGVSVILWN